MDTNKNNNRKAFKNETKRNKTKQYNIKQRK